MNVNAETEARFRAIMTERGNDPVIVEMSIGDIFATVSFLQLAMRHPLASRTRTAIEVRKVIGAIRETLVKVDPSLGEIIDAGDDPAYDVVQHAGGSPS